MSDFHTTLESMKASGLPVVAMAGILRMDRKTVHAWLDGAEVDASASERHAVVRPLIDEAFGTNLKTVFRLWNTRNRDGMSLGELLAAETVDTWAVKDYLAFFAPAIRRYTAQDAAPRPSGRGGNPLSSTIVPSPFSETTRLKNPIWKEDDMSIVQYDEKFDIKVEAGARALLKDRADRGLIAQPYGNLD